MDKWALVTTYKVNDPPEANFRFMETFVNFYRKKWGVTQEILLVGVPRELCSLDSNILDDLLRRFKALNGNTEFILSTVDYNIILEKQETMEMTMGRRNLIDNIKYFKGNKTDLLLYSTNKQTTNPEWNIIKNILFQIANLELDSSYNKVINIDSDEFLVLSDDRKPNDIEEFHYIDYVSPNLGEEFNIEEEMKWCLQPWYYRQIYHHLHPKLDTVINEIFHGWCKKFAFNRSEMWKAPSIHTGKTTLSEACKNVTKENYKNFNIGYHLQCLDYNHYSVGKTKMFVESQTANTFNALEEQLEHNYVNYYGMSKTYREHFSNITVVDNLIKDYWSN